MWHNALTAVRQAIRSLPDLDDVADLRGLPGLPLLRRLARRAGWAGLALRACMPGDGRTARRPARRTRAAALPGAAQLFEAEAEAELPLDPERPLGCGWFDSSHDLRAGLQVQEHASADAVAQELPVDFWLRLHLAEWRGQPSA
jgi:hypothetical protein